MGGLGLCRIDLGFILSEEGYLCRGNTITQLYRKKAHSASIMQDGLGWCKHEGGVEMVKKANTGGFVQGSSSGDRE